MKNLTQFINFSAVARHGSFANAARDLGLAPSSVAKSVARLEADLGARLFHRTTRSVALTEEGRRLFEKCSRLLDEIDALDLHPIREDDEPAGVLRIGAPVGYGTRVILPRLATLQDRFPALDIDLRLSDERVNLLDGGLDAAIRFGELEDSTLMARKIDEQNLVLCASPSYLKRHAPIQSISGLAGHRTIAFRLPTIGRDRALQFVEDGEPVSISGSARFHISHGEALVHAALLGIGVPQIPQFFAQPFFESGALIELLHSFRPQPLSVSLILPSSRNRPPRVEALVKLLTGSP
jgi:LysR family transcriptional regulator for bpeEF and oprC